MNSLVPHDRERVIDVEFVEVRLDVERVRRKADYLIVFLSATLFHLVITITVILIRGL